MSYPAIENHGVIGDLHTVALVAKDGSIDFLCWPRFDSPSIFCSLIDDREGGSFQIAPLFEAPRRRQMYLPDTNVLLTRFLSEDGVVELSDFMPVDEEGGHAHVVIRRVKTVRGEVRYRMVCWPRFDYARAPHELFVDGGEAIFASRGADGTVLRLRSAVPLRVEGGAATAEFVLRAGESAAFVLEGVLPGEPSRSAAPDYVPEVFKATVNYWRRWVGRSTYAGRWREMVHRSALALKLLTSKPYGSIVAAPTFGLPEKIGGVRNWDYRYTWIRDASFTLYALIRLGYTQEAAAFMRWVGERCAELADSGALRLMYGVDGAPPVPELSLDNLDGYRGSRPVRVGNNAYGQLQLDIYGELMDSVYLHDKYGAPITVDLWRDVVRLVDWVATNWRQPDEGIWEVRGGRQHFLHSRVMCWVALDRAVRLAAKRGYPAPHLEWRAARDAIFDEVMDEFFDPELEAFVQTKGGRSLDASSLLMPLVKMISPVDRRWLSTMRAIERELLHDSLVFRYLPDRAAPDGLVGDEGTFSMCSFWYVECLSRAGDLDKARFYFEKMLGYANHVGLYGEQLGPRGEHLGNFPQAFTHVALISAAYDLDRRLSASGWRA